MRRIHRERTSLFDRLVTAVLRQDPEDEEDEDEEEEEDKDDRDDDEGDDGYSE